MSAAATSAIGVDIGGTRIRAARVDAAGVIHAHVAVATPATVADALAAIDAAIVALDRDDVRAIGVGVPGRVDGRSGAVLSGGYVNLAGPPLASRLARLAGRPLSVANDGAMALLAEARIGAGRNAANLVLLTIGTGVGGAAMIEGRVAHGAGFAGQFGHITVAFDGAPCRCGRRGCLETTSSGSALNALIQASGLDAGTTAEALLADGRAEAAAVLQRWTRPLREGVDSLIAAFDPERVILGGGLGAAAAEALARHPGASPWFQRPVVAAELGDRAGVIGAALAALERAG